MRKDIIIVSTEVMKYNPEWDRFECKLSDLGWDTVPDAFLLFNPGSGIKETLSLESIGVENQVPTWRYESGRYAAVVKNI